MLDKLRQNGMNLPDIHLPSSEQETRQLLACAAVQAVASTPSHVKPTLRAAEKLAELLDNGEGIAMEVEPDTDKGVDIESESDGDSNEDSQAGSSSSVGYEEGEQENDVDGDEFDFVRFTCFFSSVM